MEPKVLPIGKLPLYYSKLLLLSFLSGTLGYTISVFSLLKKGEVKLSLYYSLGVYYFDSIFPISCILDLVSLNKLLSLAFIKDSSTIGISFSIYSYFFAYTLNGIFYE